MDLNTDVTTLDRAYKLQAKKLEKLGIKTISDLLYHIPKRYEDLRIVSKIADAKLSETVTIKGIITSLKNEYRSRRFTIQKIKIEDDTDGIECRFFNQPYLIKSLKEGDVLSLSGTIDFYGKTKCLSVKEYEVLETLQQETIHTGRLTPVYPLTYGLSSKWLRNKIYTILKKQNIELNEFLPEKILHSHKFPEFSAALHTVHFPADFEDVASSLKRLSYEELFLVQLGALLRQQSWEKKEKAPVFKIKPFQKEIDALFKSLPFTLTTAQIKAIDDIIKDVTQSIPMNRLLEGDVGSGKTVVAAISMYIAHLNGFQSILMAPTEILAHQHFATVSKLFEPLGITVGLSTGSKKTKSDKPFDMHVGTHSLLHTTQFSEKLGLVIIDEQQRFGVEQRGVLRTKGKSPHFLSMTATPIPRTVFLTLYGDLSLSVLDEMPKGRVRVKTWLTPNQKREKGYEWIKEKILEVDELGQRNQVFIICPFIEESESATTIKAATKEYERLSKSVFKDFKVGLLHGKLKAKEKNEVLLRFEKGEFDVLVATPVVEVGIDIPNATIMVIEAAERFGLAQLHQLRGRVGRRQRESFCLLYTESQNAKTQERLKSLETIYVGAELAELDLKLRGPGEIYGTQQHGSHNLKIASFSDFELILQSKKDAEKIFPELETYPVLKNRVEQENTKNILPD